MSHVFKMIRVLRIKNCTFYCVTVHIEIVIDDDGIDLEDLNIRRTETAYGV